MQVFHPLTLVKARDVIISFTYVGDESPTEGMCVEVLHEIAPLYEPIISVVTLVTPDDDFE